MVCCVTGNLEADDLAPALREKLMLADHPVEDDIAVLRMMLLQHDVLGGSIGPRAGQGHFGQYSLFVSG